MTTAAPVGLGARSKAVKLQITAAIQSWRSRGSRRHVQKARDVVAAGGKAPQACSASDTSWGLPGLVLVLGCPASMPGVREGERMVSRRRDGATLWENGGSASIGIHQPQVRPHLHSLREPDRLL